MFQQVLHTLEFSHHQTKIIWQAGEIIVEINSIQFSDKTVDHSVSGYLKRLFGSFGCLVRIFQE